jgi:transposase
LSGGELGAMDWIAAARALWPRVQPFLPEPPTRDARRGGRPRIPDEEVFFRLVVFLRAGCSWQVFDELCKGGPVSGRTCRQRLACWRDAGVFEQVCALIQDDLPDCPIGHLDAVFVRARGGGEEVGLTRHGKGSKIQALVDEQSRPHAFLLTSANPHEATITPQLLELLDHLPELVVADKAYDSDDLRDEFNRLDSTLLAPHRSTRKRPPRDQQHIGRHYKNRYRVERFFAWLAAWRRLTTRYERNVLHYHAWLCLGIALTITRTGFSP